MRKNDREAIERLALRNAFQRIRIDKLPFLAAIAYNAHSRKAGRTCETAPDPSVSEAKLIDLAQAFNRAETVFGYTEYRVLADLISGRLSSRPRDLAEIILRRRL